MVGRNVHPTIPKGNGYEQCTVPDTIALEQEPITSLEPILLLLSFSRFANILPWSLVPFFQISPEEQWTQNHPQYLSGLSRALFPSTFHEIAVYMRPTTQAQTFLVAGCMTSAGGYNSSDGKTESTVFHSSSISQFIPPVLQAFVRHILMDTSVTA